MLRNPAILYVEYLGIFIGFQNLREVLAVGVGDEDLSEIVTLHQIDDALDPLAVQTVEDVIEEQDGLIAIYHLVIYHLFIYLTI